MSPNSLSSSNYGSSLENQQISARGYASGCSGMHMNTHTISDIPSKSLGLRVKNSCVKENSHL